MDPEFTTIGKYFFDYQHWITVVGLVATLGSLVFGYRKMQGQIELFRLRAVSDFSIAGLATAQSSIKELMTSQNYKNKELLLHRLFGLNELMITIRVQLPDVSDSARRKLQTLSTRGKGFEERITTDLQLKVDEFNRVQFISHLTELRAAVSELSNELSVLAKGSVNDSK